MADDPVAAVLSRLKGVRKSGDEWSARCPAHDDRNPSLSVSRGRDGRALLYCRGGCEQESIVAALGIEMSALFASSNGSRPEIVATYDYTDEAWELLFQTVRYFPKDFRQRRPDGKGGWIWNLKGCRRVLYRLPQVLEAVAQDKLVFVAEGEKDVHAVEHAGGIATTNPMGAGKWRPDYCEPLRGARVRIVAHIDASRAGENHAREVAASLEGVAASVELVEAKEGKDAHDHLAAGHTLDDFVPLDLATIVDTPRPTEAPAHDAVTLDDFRAFMPRHQYIFTPTRDLWPASSVNARVPPVPTGKETEDGKGEFEAASKWLDRERPVEQLTWSPGQPEIIEDRVISGGGWIERPGLHCFNLYRPPAIKPGDPTKAGPWLELIRRVFPDAEGHIVRYFAHRAQRPHEKINHALVMTGPQGTGKDSIVAGIVPAVGPWNVWEVGPDQIMGRFSPWKKSVILRVSEARDLGERDRYRFYEHTKTLIAAPPDVLTVDEKNIPEYVVPNVLAVVITSNHMDGIYLPADDRRHYVATTECTKGDFTESYWTGLYKWYEADGCRHVAAYLASVDLDGWNPKAPPSKTSAFWSVVDAGRAPEDAELADAIDKLMQPHAVTLAQIANVADPGFAEWLRDRKNSRQIPHRMEEAGYTAVRNDGTKDGRWKVGGKNQVIYASRELSVRDRIQAARTLVEGSR